MNYDGAAFCQYDSLAKAAGEMCRWPSADVPLSVNTAIGRLSADEVFAAFEIACRRWNAVCGINLSVVRSGGFINVTTGRIDGPSGTLAWSELPCGGASRLSQKYDGDENWSSADNAPSSTIDLRRVACHEIGHAIGIEHIGNGNLMAPYYSTAIIQPQTGDIAEAVARYGRPNQPPPPPPPPDPGTYPTLEQIQAAAYRAARQAIDETVAILGKGK